ncbi:MAG: hypothetical protein ABR514_06950 [Chthoniobacterales bacterium]
MFHYLFPLLFAEAHRAPLSKLMTERALPRLQFFSRRLAESRNRNATGQVLVNSVDAISATWTRLMRACWWRLHSIMTMLPLVNWFVVFTRLSQKWSVPIDRDELLRRTFARSFL